MNTEQFFVFELENGLFDIVDSRGLRPWEAVRYYVYNRIYSNREPVEKKTSPSKITLKRLFHFIRRKLFFLVYILRHLNSPYLFLLCSRDKKDGFYYDKICGSSFEEGDKTKIFAIESCVHDYNYKYAGFTCERSFFSVLLRCLSVDFDFILIKERISAQYPDFPIEIGDLENWYKEFLAQYYYFRFLFRLLGTKKMFMVQNGILKGVFAAAKEQGVEVIEYQHGQISVNHPAYSYPEKVDSLKIYQPSKLLVFGEFWTKNRYYPGVKNIVIGNKFYFKKNDNQMDMHLKKRLLVISDKFEGKRLAKYVKSILELDTSFSFYFKLHPNQYSEFDFYQNEFHTYENVEVVSDSMSINELLSESEGILVVQSTVELEALRDGKIVFVVGEGAYEMMDFVFKEPGVYLINSAQDFVDKYSYVRNDRIMPRGDLFAEYNNCVIETLFNL